MFRAVSDVRMTESTGLRTSTAIALLLLVAAAVLSRPDRNPSAWLLARPDRWALLRLVVVLGGLPLLVGLSRVPFLALGLGTEAAWILATTIATVIVGVAVFYLSQREQSLLIQKEALSVRYRILADNAVDVIIHLHGSRVTWVSPSVQAAFGDPPAHWVGSDLRDRIHPDDLVVLDRDAPTRWEMQAEAPVKARFRVRTADGGYHWVDGNAKPYLDADGHPDGVITALRIVDDQVEAQQRLDRLARFDTLTGLPEPRRGDRPPRISPGTTSIPWLGSGHPVLRRRPLQDHQRHVRARRRRRGAGDPRGANQRKHPTRGHRRSDGR